MSELKNQQDIAHCQLSGPSCKQKAISCGWDWTTTTINNNGAISVGNTELGNSHLYTLSISKLWSLYSTRFKQVRSS